MPSDEKASGPCTRLQGLIERQVIDRSEISTEETRFIEEHLRQCPECAAFSQALDMLGTVPRVDPSRRGAIVSRALGARRRRRLTRSVLAISGVTLAVAVILLVVFNPWRDTSGARLPPLSVTSGEVEVENVRLGLGENLVEGARVRVASTGALLEAGPRLTVGFEEGTRFRVERWGEQVEIHLEQGTMTCRIDGLQEPRMVVSFPGGRAIPIGTFFAVHASKDLARIDVMEGAVRIERTPGSGGRIHLEAGSSVMLPGGKTRPLDQDRRDAVVALLRVQGDVAAQPVAATPVPSPSEPSMNPVDETPARDIPPDPVVSTPPKPAVADAKTQTSPSLTDLLDEARSCRKSKDWKCAAQAYELIRTEYAERPEAVTVLVPLAQIELAHLDLAGKALAHFELYLAKRPKGTLAQEALFGKARALRALGRTDEEIAALKLFLALYPSSVHAPSVESRLDTLAQ